MKNELTQEERDLMPVVRDEWINRTLKSGQPAIDPAQAREFAGFLYGLAKLPEPGLVLVAQSPLGAQMMAQIMQVRDQVWGQVWNQVRGQVVDHVGGQVRDQVWGQVWDQVGGKVWGQVWDQVGRQVWDQVRGQVGYIPPLWLFADVGWVAYGDFFSRIGIALPPLFDAYKTRLIGVGVWEALMFNGMCVFCELPWKVIRNEANQLHNDQGPAIEWRDGFKLWFLRGVAFDYDEWEKIVGQTFEISDLLKIENADKKAVATSMLSASRLLEHVNAIHINTGVKGTELYQVDNFLNSGSTEYCMKMVCPSTGREFIEWVNPEVGKKGDADLAQAAAWIDEDGKPLALEDYLTAVEA